MVNDSEESMIHCGFVPIDPNTTNRLRWNQHINESRRFKEQRCTAGRELCGDVHSEAKKEDNSMMMTVDDEDYGDVYNDFEHANQLRVMKRHLCPAHDRVWSETLTHDRRSRVVRLFSKLLYAIAGLLYILCPPWPPWVIKKIAFRAPPRGEYYYLIGGKKDDRRIHFSAREAYGVENLQICLPHLLRPRVKAIDIYYHILRCKPIILNLYEDIRICAMEVMCEQTEKWLRRAGSRRTRSPKLVIFAQPNSSDIGCCMLMDPNFVDIADFLKCDMLVFDYAGYGVSDGKPTEKSVYDSVERVYKYAVTDLEYRPKDIILIGFSLGTAAMVHIASITPDLGAMVLIAPFTSLWRVIFRRPHVSASSCMDMFPSYEKAHNIRCPTLVCHGDQDAIVDHQHGLAMKERIANCELFIIPASHQGIFCERKMWDDVNRFLREKVSVMEAWIQAVQESSSDVSGVIYN